MNFKTTYILFGTLVGLLVLVVITALVNSKSETGTAYLLPSLNKDKITAEEINTVIIERRRPKEEKLVFTRSDQGWQINEPIETRAAKTEVEPIVSQLLRAAKEEKGADVTNDLRKYGLETPAMIVTLKKGTDREWQLFIGDESGGKENALVYVRSSDRPNEVMAVRRYNINTLFKNLTDFRSRDLLTEGVLNARDAIQSIQLEEPKRDPVVLVKGADTRWRFEKPDWGEADEEGESMPSGLPEQREKGVRGLLEAIAQLRIEPTDFVADGVSDKDLAGYGLDRNPERLRLQIKLQNSSKEAVTAVLLVGKKADDKGEKFHARLEDEKSVVRIEAKKLEPIFKMVEKPDQLRNRDLADFDQGRTDAIDIRNASGLIKLRKAGEPETWKVADDGKVREADHLTVLGLIHALTAKRQVKEFPDPKKADLGFDKPVAVVSVWVEGIQRDEKTDKTEEKKPETDKKPDEKKPETDKKPEKKDAEPQLKKDAKPVIQLTFGNREKDLVYVKREAAGKTSVLAIPDTIVAKLTPDRLAYLDRVLPSFSLTADVIRLKLVRGNQTYEIDKVKKDDKALAAWTFRQPKELAGRTADGRKVEDLIRELAQLRAERLVAEKPPDAELDRYGLKLPRAQATVTIRQDEKKTDDRVYLFGHEEDKSKNSYARQGEQPLVFTVRPDVVKNLLETDLLDLSVLSFDLDKLKTMKLTGWKELTGDAFVLETERKSRSNWVILKRENFKPDESQLEDFARSLSQLRAEKFVAQTGGARPEHKLDLKDAALEVVLTVEGEKDPLKLTIGGLDPDKKSYYAQCSKVPGAIFLLPKERFEKPKAKPAYFRKD